MLNQLDEITREIYHKYRYALKAIGVKTARQDVQEAIINCNQGMEAAFQRTIEYWLYLQETGTNLDYPSALLIKALEENWVPRHWQKSYLEDPRLKSPCQIWWEEALEIWGEGVRNSLVADVSDRDGVDMIFFSSGAKMQLKVAEARGWEAVLEYAQRSGENSYANLQDSL